MTNIAIDIGTSYITVYAKGNNVVLREPSVLAYIGEENDLRAVGKEALEMQGKTNEKINFVAPIVDGYIEDEESAATLLGELLRKIFPTLGKLFGTSLSAIVSVPVGITVDERKKYEDVCVRAGIKRVEMVDKVLLAALGAELPKDGALVVCIGGGSTEIAIVSFNSIVTGCSINVGGNMMDRALSDYVSGKCGIRLGKHAARKTKESSASLYEDDVAKEEIKGLNADTLMPVMAELYTADLRRAIEPYYDRIAETVMCIFNDCPPALAQALHERGLFVCGGGAKIPGLKEFLAKKTSLPVTICSDPEYVTALGGGILISDPDLLEEIIAQ